MTTNIALSKQLTVNQQKLQHEQSRKENTKKKYTVNSPCFCLKKTNISTCSGMRLDRKWETISLATENILSAGVDVVTMDKHFLAYGASTKNLLSLNLGELVVAWNNLQFQLGWDQKSHSDHQESHFLVECPEHFVTTVTVLSSLSCTLSGNRTAGCSLMGQVRYTRL